MSTVPPNLSGPPPATPASEDWLVATEMRAALERIARALRMPGNPSLVADVPTEVERRAGGFPAPAVEVAEALLRCSWFLDEEERRWILSREYGCGDPLAYVNADLVEDVGAGILAETEQSLWLLSAEQYPWKGLPGRESAPEGVPEDRTAAEGESR